MARLTSVLGSRLSRWFDRGQAMVKDRVNVRPRPIETDAFRPFGDVIAPSEAGRMVNRGAARRYDHIAELVQSRGDAEPNLALFEVSQASFPKPVDWLERHNCSTQVFVPLTPGRYLAVVAAADCRAIEHAPNWQAFLVPPGTGISYRPGIWHHGLLPLDRDMRFAMLVWENGSPADCEIVDLAPTRSSASIWSDG